MSDQASRAEPVPRREDLPDGSARIHFAQPIPRHAEPTHFCTFRPFTMQERLEHGDPLEWIVQGEGADAITMRSLDRPALIGWIKRLLVDHDFDVLARERDPMLADIIEDTVLGFFRKARRWSSLTREASSAPASPSSSLAE